MEPKASKEPDIRRWFMKQPHKSNTVKDTNVNQGDGKADTDAPRKNQSKSTSSDAPGNVVNQTPMKKSLDKQLNSDNLSLKRKKENADLEIASEVKPPPSKRFQKQAQKHEEVHESMDPDGDKMSDGDPKVSSESAPSGRGAGQGGGRGRGGGSAGGGRGSAGGGRGRGGGRGFGGNFGDRGPPPHKGEKEVPQGAENCLSGLTFVISGTLDSLEREEAEDLIKSHGGRITTSVSKKTSYLLADEDIGGRKSQKAKELGVKFLTEDGLFEMIRKSKPPQPSAKEPPIKEQNDNKSIQKNSDSKRQLIESSSNKDRDHNARNGKMNERSVQYNSNKALQTSKAETAMWTEKYRPKTPNDIVGNQTIVKQLHEWLANWENEHLNTGEKGKKGNKRTGAGNKSSNTSKKAVIMSGPPGIGKTTAARLVSQMLGFETIEVNASDSRGKADSKIVKGISGSTANSIKEMITNATIHRGLTNGGKKSVLIMDEVDGMSGGDRGGVSDLIASIKISKIPIICICNDRYSQKLKSLMNSCLPLNFRKPTKQQMAKRLRQVAELEGIKVDEAALEELGERVNGDMRMALNQLQYMSLSFSAIKYADIKSRLKDGGKDEDITPFTAANKLLGVESSRLRMDEKMDLCMSDPDLVPLLIQENYLNYKPNAAGRDVDGSRRMDLISRAADSIADGDIINKQIRRYQQWQHSQMGAFASSIIPSAFIHGYRETFVQGEQNFNRFGAWLGKNSTFGKHTRLLSDVHVHILASSACELSRENLRLDYLSVLLTRLTNPLKTLPKDEAVQAVLDFMDEYSLSQEDFDTIVELSKFQGHLDPLKSIPPAVKAALTKGYKQNEQSRRVRTADLIPALQIPGQKKAPKTKRVAKLLNTDEGEFPLNEEQKLEEEGDSEEEEEEDSDVKEQGIKLSLEEDKPKGLEIELDIKGREAPKTKSSKATATKSNNGRAKAGAEAKGVKRKR